MPRSIFTTVQSVALAAIIVCAVGGARAASLTDPLGVVPSVIESGVVLPGDRAPVACVMSRDFTVELTLADAVDIALCGNPRVQAAWAEIKAQGERRGRGRVGLPANADRVPRA